MFDDLRDPQPAEEGDEQEIDELLSDMPPEGEQPPEPEETVAAFDIEPRFGDEPMFDEEPILAGSSPFDDDLMFGDMPSARAATRRRRFLGMTAQQRAVLAFFLFLDVSVMGCVLLLAAERISLP